MSAVTVKVIGSEQVAARMQARGLSVGQTLLRAITDQAFRLEAYVKTQKLTGGNPLHARTGRLRRSVHSTVTQEAGRVLGTVGTNVEYAAAHEFGGTVTVKKHLRLVTEAWGRPVRNPRRVPVRKHQATYPKRSFLRSALRELAPEIRDAVSRALGQALRVQP